MQEACTLASTPPGMPGTHPPIFWLGGRQREYPRQYYYVLLDIADQYRLPSVRSASSRFHSAIRRHQFASVRQADSRLTRLVPPNLELALTPLIAFLAFSRLAISALASWCRVSHFQRPRSKTVQRGGGAVSRRRAGSVPDDSTRLRVCGWAGRRRYYRHCAAVASGVKGLSR